MPDKRIGVFVDVSSLHRNIRNIYDGKLDYHYYLSSIRKIGQIYRAFAYGVQKDDNARKFIDFLQIIGFETSYLPVKVGRDGKTYRIDRSGQMIIDMVRIIDKLDTVVFGTSNTIIVPAIIYAKEQGCKTLVFACNIPREMKECSDRWWEITEDYLEREKTNGKNGKEENNKKQDEDEEDENEENGDEYENETIEAENK
jgi:uncharacterized LabA/DUF88 family protein